MDRIWLQITIINRSQKHHAVTLAPPTFKNGFPYTKKKKKNPFNPLTEIDGKKPSNRSSQGSVSTLTSASRQPPKPRPFLPRVIPVTPCLKGPSGGRPHPQAFLCLFGFPAPPTWQTLKGEIPPLSWISGGTLAPGEGFPPVREIFFFFFFLSTVTLKSYFFFYWFGAFLRPFALRFGFTWSVLTDFVYFFFSFYLFNVCGRSRPAGRGGGCRSSK